MSTPNLQHYSVDNKLLAQIARRTEDVLQTLKVMQAKVTVGLVGTTDSAVTTDPDQLHQLGEELADEVQLLMESYSNLVGHNL